MRRLAFLLILLLLIPSISQARPRGIYRTVGSGTVTQANMKLSGVDGGSTASGGAFVDFGAANVLTTKVGHLLKITDSAGKSIIGYTKSAMAGESLDTEIATGTLTALKLYKITATEVNHFGTGKVVGSYFTSAGTETCDANNKVQQVLIGATTGVTIVSAQDGTQYNWFNKNSAFNWNDASGYTYQIIQENGKHIYSSAITSGTLHLDASNTAMFFHDSIDFSSYAGTDAGSTPYLLCFYDSSGYMASAYGGAVGGGESLDSEIFDDTGFDDDSKWNKETGVTVSGSKANWVSPVTSGIYQNNKNSYANKLYKYSVDVVRTVGQLIPPYGGTDGIYVSSSGTYTGYMTSRSNRTAVWIYGYSFQGTADNVSYKNVLDIPVTGLHLFTTKNGTTRGMATKASSFNPNTITSVKIYRAY